MLQCCIAVKILLHFYLQYDERNNNSKKQLDEIFIKKKYVLKGKKFFTSIAGLQSKTIIETYVV